MLVYKKILWLRERIKEQKDWINRCGGNLSGYIAHYGDPGTPPLDEHGDYKVITVPVEKQYLIPDYERVPETTDKFYAGCYGEGGTKIYEADYGRLVSWQNELNELETHCHAAKQKADALDVGIDKTEYEALTIDQALKILTEAKKKMGGDKCLILSLEASELPDVNVNNMEIMFDKDNAYVEIQVRHNDIIPNPMGN